MRATVKQLKFFLLLKGMHWAESVLPKSGGDTWWRMTALTGRDAFRVNVSPRSSVLEFCYDLCLGGSGQTAQLQGW